MFIYYEKATKFCEIFTLFFVAFSEYMNKFESLVAGTLLNNLKLSNS